MNSNFDNWILFGEYTRLHFKESTSYEISSSSEHDLFFSFWQIPIRHFPVIESLGSFKVSSKWYLKIDIGDLILGRPYYVGTNLTFNPYVGVRAYRIDQKYNFLTREEEEMEATNYFYINENKNKSDSWGLGTKFGIDTNWILGAGFRLFGDMSLSICYQHFKLYQNLWYYQYEPGESDVSNAFGSVSKEKDKVLPNVNTVLGFGWGTYFDNCNWHFDLTASYDFNYFWQQNMMQWLNQACWTSYNVVSGTGSYLVYMNTAAAKDLILHGLTITARLDF